MGVSTDALIVYGVEVGEIEELRERLDGEAWDELIDSFYDNEDGFGLIEHCSDSYLMYFVGYLIIRADRGFPKLINEAKEKDLDVRRIQRFCEKYELPYSQPDYYLASYWG